MNNPTRPPKPSDIRQTAEARHDEAARLEARRRQRELRLILGTALAGLAAISVLWRLLE